MDEQSISCYKRDKRDIKLKTILLPVKRSTLIWAIACSCDNSLNHDLRIPLREGEPLHKAVYDVLDDCYVVRGCDVLELGFIPISYRHSMEDIVDFGDHYTPLPKLVVLRYLNLFQKSSWNSWSKRFAKRNFKISFLQALGDY